MTIKASSKFLVSIIYACTLLLTTACDRSTDNGAIDGFWQLTKIVHTVNDTIVEQDTKELQVFWAVQLELLLIYSETTYSSTFNLQNNQLHLNLLHNIKDKPLEASELAPLEKFGITSVSPTFDIIILNKKTLILRRERTELHFRRY